MDMDRIVYEDNYILVYNKPAGLAVQTKKVTEPDLESAVRGYLFAAGGEPYLGLVHRLDQPVEGLVLFAKTPGAAELLSRKIGTDEVVKRYAAVVEGRPEVSEGELTDYVVWDGRTNLAKVVPRDFRGEGGRKAARSRLYYKVLEEVSFEGREISLLDIRLYSGRHHQIRVQLSNMGCPIIGDRKYNTLSPAAGMPSYPALAAYSLSFPHPDTGEMIDLSIKPSNILFNCFHHF